LLFAAGVLLLIARPMNSLSLAPPRCTAALLTVPFVVNWVAVAAGLHPYGRTRQCIFLAVFGLAGVSVTLAKIGRNRVGAVAALALAMAATCQAFGTLQGRDMLPLAAQRREHMDQALQFIRSGVSPQDAILTDRATSFQLRHYLCGKAPAPVEPSNADLSLFRCDGLQVLSTGANAGALTAQTVAARARNVEQGGLSPRQLWVVQAGWASGLGETLRRQSPSFARIDVHSFGPSIEVFEVPLQSAGQPQAPRQR
jgi:hypothetical protein